MMVLQFGLAGSAAARFVVMGGDGADAVAARAAVALVGGTVIAAPPGDGDAPPAIPGEADAVVLILEGVAEAALAPWLNATDATCAARALPLIVAMTVAQIDPVVATLGDRVDAVQLLCTPDQDQAEWVAALAIATAGSTPGDRVRSADDERERAARLQAEVARIAELLARIAADDGAGGGSRAADRHARFGAPPPSVDIAAATIRDVLRSRRMRDRFFGTGLFEDPAWDMLLDLFAAALEGTRVSVSSLCIAAAVAPTTALRWIGKLTAADLLHRNPDPEDRRRAFVSLSPAAQDAMYRYVAALAEAKLPLV
ncbi:winged helix DNA-binding protein [uncultured Sphingomonas sp.]|uniref:winged helix DNA-binding protein n=1 Tax=uncultured Sphingomonas sp. TaxID=158754 RepID=UPI002587A8E6|nr:winged helix DNA-binding protein [uncultured Sphingomonas sp.]